MSDLGKNWLAYGWVYTNKKVHKTNVDIMLATDTSYV